MKKLFIALFGMIMGLATTTEAQTNSITWKFESAVTADEQQQTVTSGSTLVDGKEYVFKSIEYHQGTTDPFEIHYIANGSEDKLQPVSNVPGYSTELSLGGITEDNKGYFRIPLSYPDNMDDVIGILTIAGGNAEGGELEVYIDAAFTEKYATVYVPKCTKSSMEITFPASAKNLYIKVVRKVSLVGMHWEVKPTTVQYSLSYYANGATSGSVPSVTYHNKDTQDTQVTLEGNTGNLQKVGHTFGGWQVDRSGDVLAAGSTLTITANTQLYAVWNKKDYTVTYSSADANGSLEILTTAGTHTSGNTLPFGTSIQMKVTPNTGYILDKITVNGKDKTYSDGSVLTVPAEAVNIVAHFKSDNTEYKTVGADNNSWWGADFSPFYKLDGTNELLFSFEVEATNEWYHSWLLEISQQNQEHHLDWSDMQHSYMVTSARCDAYSQYMDANWQNPLEFYEVKLYDLANNTMYASRDVPGSFYQDIKSCKVTLRVVTDGINTFVHARMISMVPGREGKTWLYTTAVRKKTEGTLLPLYAAISIDNEKISKLTVKSVPTYKVNTAVEPQELAERANVRVQTPEGVVLPNGISVGYGDAMTFVCEEIEGYTFMGWGTNVDRTENPLIGYPITEGLTFTATYHDNTIPVITTTVPEVIYLGGGAARQYGISSNSAGRFSLEIADNAVANVTVQNNVLTITPKTVGVLSFKLIQAAYNGMQASEEQITIKVEKRPTYISMTNDLYECNLADVSNFEHPVIKVMYRDDSGVEQELTNAAVTMVSDNQTVATVSGTTITPVLGTDNKPASVGTANIRLNYTGNDSFAAAEDFFCVVYRDGASVQADTPADGVLKDKSNNDLVKYHFGGWAWNEKTYMDPDGNKEKTDSWKKNENKYSTPMDGYSVYISGAQDAKDEAMTISTEVIYGARRYGWFKVGDPYTLPVRGTYMTFEPEVNGTLSIYIVQNGTWSTYSEAEATETNKKGDIKKGIFRPHSFYITDQNGNLVPDVTAVSNQPVLGEFTCTAEGLTQEVDDKSTNVARWADFRNYYDSDERNAIIAAWNTQGNQGVVKLKNGSYMVIQKSLVKYTLHVTAGETYYLFSNFSKMGFSGINFVKDEEMSPAAGITLSESVKYTAPAAKTQYASISLDRSFKAGQWSTITLPFYMKEEEVKATFGDGTQLIMLNDASSDGSQVSLSFIYHEIQSILAGYPYLIKPSEEVAANIITVQNKVIDPAIAQKSLSFGGYTHKGTAAYCNLDAAGASAVLKAGDIYVSNDALRIVNQTATKLRGYRTYIESPQNAAHEARMMTVPGARDHRDIDEGGETAIEILPEEDAQDMDILTSRGGEGIYTLSGQRVAAGAQLKSGIYVVNGQKIIIK